MLTLLILLIAFIVGFFSALLAIHLVLEKGWAVYEGIMVYILMMALYVFGIDPILQGWLT